LRNILLTAQLITQIKKVAGLFFMQVFVIKKNIHSVGQACKLLRRIQMIFFQHLIKRAIVFEMVLG